MKTYFDYESVIKSKDSAEAIAAPVGLGPFCGFGSATVSNDSITLYPNGESGAMTYQSMKDRIVARYMTKASDSGEASDVNFGCIARDGTIYISDSASISISTIEGSKGSNEDVLVFAYHTTLEEPVQNPVQFMAFWNESTSFYSLYKKSVDPLYPVATSARVYSSTDILEDSELSYESLENRAIASVASGLIDKTTMVLVGIYGQGTDSMTNTVENYSIVPYGGHFPQPIEYNTAIHGLRQSNAETMLQQLSSFPDYDIKSYIDEQISALSSSSGSSLVPSGLIAMWSGVEVPDGWALCNGQVVNGVQTPNLSGRFIVGWLSGDSDYGTIGNTGGSNTVTLSVAELPSHNHRVDDAYHIESKAPSNPADGYKSIGSNLTGSGDTDNDNSYASLWNHPTEDAGGDQAHENRPPYYVLAYIMKL